MKALQHCVSIDVNGTVDLRKFEINALMCGCNTKEDVLVNGRPVKRYWFDDSASANKFSDYACLQAVLYVQDKLGNMSVELTDSLRHQPLNEVLIRDCTRVSTRINSLVEEMGEAGSC